MRTVKLILFFAWTLSIYPIFAQEKMNHLQKFPVLKGPYLGQKISGTTPELFAPGIISDGLPNRDVAISPDAKEIYFGLHSMDFSYSTILFTQCTNGIWTKPEAAAFANDPRYIYLEPCLSYDGQKMFFLSNLPKDSSDIPGDEDIWVVEKTNGEWGKPYNLGAPINTEGREFYPSLTHDGTLYFTRAEAGQRIHFVYRSRLVNGQYTIPEKLPEQVNCGTNRFNAYIAQDESYIVVPALGMPDSFGGVDYYIVFRNDDDSWQEPINMGPNINSPTGEEWSFYVSPDNQYIFFMATRGLPADQQPQRLTAQFFKNLLTIPQNGNSDIYWMDAKIIYDLRSSLDKR